MLARKQQELEEQLAATEREYSNSISDYKDLQGKLKDECRALTQSLQENFQRVFSMDVEHDLIT